MINFQKDYEKLVEIFQDNPIIDEHFIALIQIQKFCKVDLENKTLLLKVHSIFYYRRENVLVIVSENDEYTLMIIKNCLLQQSFSIKDEQLQTCFTICGDTFRIYKEREDWIFTLSDRVRSIKFNIFQY